ncbi:MAG TPA: cytochrome P450 [Pseudonocardia sp.]|nr:cytochrome P450 [Pseudonocardia sp.]
MTQKRREGISVPETFLDTLRVDLRLRAQRAVLHGLALCGDTTAEIALGRSGDPYPLYERVRERGPLVRSRTGMWTVTGHSLCRQVLRDDRFGVEAGQPGEPLDLSLLELDPPDHTRLRRLAAPAFRPRLTGAYRGRMEEVAERLLDAVDRDGFDVVRDLASPLPITVITDLLGVDEGDHATFVAYGQAIGLALSGVSSARQARELQDATADLTALFTELARRRREDPREDLVSVLVAAHDTEALTAPELVALCQLLLIAGFETTVNLVGSAVHLLLDHPDQWAALAADPDLAPGAVEETLRHQSPVQGTTRVAREDVELAGQRLPAGSVVLLLLGAANRDPEVFPEPHRFDITRTTASEHLAFSSGIHYCLGAALARAEGEVALRALATRMPRLRRAGRPRHRVGATLRGLVELPVRPG